MTTSTRVSHECEESEMNLPIVSYVGLYTTIVLVTRMYWYVLALLENFFPPIEKMLSFCP